MMYVNNPELTTKTQKANEAGMSISRLNFA